MSGEAARGDRRRVSRKQHLAAMSAFRLARIPRGWDTVDARAVRADDVASLFTQGPTPPELNSMRRQTLLAVRRGKGFIEIGQILWRQANVERAAIVANMVWIARLGYRAYAVLA